MKIDKPFRLCGVDGCGKRHRGKGLCGDHYNKMYKKEKAQAISEYNKKYLATNIAIVMARHRANRAADPEKFRIARKRLYLKDPAKETAKARGWALSNRERVRATGRSAREANKQRYVARGAARRAKKLAATPRWANLEKMENFYALAVLKTKATGIAYEVDHIVPLQSRIVCGLHCEANLQVITRQENQSKRNLLWPNMPVARVDIYAC